jgi:hypothetical protein
MARRYSITRKIDRVEPICVECGGRGEMVGGAKVHPNKPERHNRIFYLCKCGAFVSCHPGTAFAAGRPAHGPVRYLRHKAHQALDAIWCGSGRVKGIATGYARHKAYKWLAAQMNIPVEECHIGRFGAAECRLVIELCTQRQLRKAA